MTAYYVATLARYVVVEAESEAQARQIGQVALYGLFADVRERLGREVPIEIRTVRPATADEIDIMRCCRRSATNHPGHAGKLRTLASSPVAVVRLALGGGISSRRLRRRGFWIGEAPPSKWLFHKARELYADSIRSLGCRRLAFAQPCGASSVDADPRERRPSAERDDGDSNPAATFGYVAEQLGKRGIAFIAARESVGSGRLGPELKRMFGGIYIANEGFSLDTANQAIAAGEADAVAFGKLFIANPDLPKRFALGGAVLNTPDPSTFYGSGPRGYTDYAALDGNVAGPDETLLAVA